MLATSARHLPVEVLDAARNSADSLSRSDFRRSRARARPTAPTLRSTRRTSELRASAPLQRHDASDGRWDAADANDDDPHHDHDDHQHQHQHYTTRALWAGRSLRRRARPGRVLLCPGASALRLRIEPVRRPPRAVGRLFLTLALNLTLTLTLIT